MSQKIVDYLNDQFKCKMINDGVKFDYKGLSFLYSDGTIFNLKNDDAKKTEKVYIVQNFIDYSVKKALKQKQK